MMDKKNPIGNFLKRRPSFAVGFLVFLSFVLLVFYFDSQRQAKSLKSNIGSTGVDSSRLSAETSGAFNARGSGGMGWIGEAGLGNTEIGGERRKINYVVHHADLGEEITEPLPPFGYGTLMITNKRKQDIILYIKDAYTGEIKRSVYVLGGRTHTVYQIGQGTYIIYYVSGTGWDKGANTFKNKSIPVYVGDYWEYKERLVPQGLEMTSHNIVIATPDNPDEDNPEMAEKTIYQQRALPKEDIGELIKLVEQDVKSAENFGR